MAVKLKDHITARMRSFSMPVCWALVRARKVGSLEALVPQPPAMAQSASVTLSACHSLGNNNKKKDLHCDSAAWLKKKKRKGEKMSFDSYGREEL